LQPPAPGRNDTLRVNLILFEPAELARPLPHPDRRARHIIDVLRRQTGDSFDAGLVNGPRGKATLAAITADALHLTFAWGPPPPPPDPIMLLVGLPRPQTARDVLRDATTLGVAAIHFVRTEKSDASYAQSTLWSSGEWRRHLVAGAEQAFDPRIPEVTSGRALADVVATLPAAAARLALDHYESPSPLSGYTGPATLPHVLALGGERGWSGRDRDVLRSGGFHFVHLGPRVLRTETAVIAALALLRARLGLM
jgi:RsmE family RNA methyltransferase